MLCSIIYYEFFFSRQQRTLLCYGSVISRAISALDTAPISFAPLTHLYDRNFISLSLFGNKCFIFRALWALVSVSRSPFSLASLESRRSTEKAKRSLLYFSSESSSNGHADGRPQEPGAGPDPDSDEPGHPEDPRDVQPTTECHWVPARPAWGLWPMTACRWRRKSSQLSTWSSNCWSWSSLFRWFRLVADACSCDLVWLLTFVAAISTSCYACCADFD